MFVCRLEPIVQKYTRVDTGVYRRIIGDTEPGLRAAMRLTTGQHGHDKVITDTRLWRCKCGGLISGHKPGLSVSVHVTTPGP